MKLKKQTRLLMLTASAVAVVGVAAVSFAAWTGSNTELTANASTGEAYLFGFTQDQSTANKPFEGALVPYDQPEASWKSENATTVATLELPEYVVYENFNIKVEINTTELTSVSTLYVNVGEEVTALPENWSTSTEGWFAVTASAGHTFNFVKADKETVTHVNLILVSETNDDTQMGKSTTFNITLETVAVTNPNA